MIWFGSDALSSFRYLDYLLYGYDRIELDEKNSCCRKVSLEELVNFLNVMLGYLCFMR